MINLHAHGADVGRIKVDWHQRRENCRIKGGRLTKDEIIRRLDLDLAAVGTFGTRSHADSSIGITCREEEGIGRHRRGERQDHDDRRKQTGAYTHDVFLSWNDLDLPTAHLDHGVAVIHSMLPAIVFWFWERREGAVRGLRVRHR